VIHTETTFVLVRVNSWIVAVRLTMITIHESTRNFTNFLVSPRGMMRRAQLIVTAAMLLCLLFQTASVSPMSSARAHASAPPTTDWSKALIESTMKRYPTADSLKGWGYARALYFYGVYLTYLRTKDKRYLDHIQAWVDLHIDDKGTINHSLSALDFLMPGNLLLILYKETKQEKYKLAAASIRKVYDTYPRTKDGGFWHANTPSRQWQLWADGVFMGLPFLARYGQMFGDSAYANDEVTKQLLIYYKHLNDPATGLLWHAYDESGAQSWANPVTHQSGYHWGRAIGWFGMTLIQILDILPKNQPHRDELIAIVQQLAKAYEKYQDPATGLWFQIVDKAEVAGNWLETSSSCMYSYMMWMGVRRGYLPKHFADVARKGYRGVLTKLSIGQEGLTNLVDVGEGTNVSDLAYYFARKRPVNDFHGLGAFLIMNEELGAAGIGYKPKPMSWK
jgi:unsaturated rhamnogalacturonyl hydrolase